MAKGKMKPAPKAKAKKAEPSKKKVIEDVILEAAKDGVISKEELKAIQETEATGKPTLVKKKKAPAKKVVVKVPVVEVKKEVEVCKHPQESRKRVIGRNMRVMHICTECNEVVKYGGR